MNSLSRRLEKLGGGRRCPACGRPGPPPPDAKIKINVKTVQVDENGRPVPEPETEPERCHVCGREPYTIRLRGLDEKPRGTMDTLPPYRKHLGDANAWPGALE